jgi:hypothetical protein
MSEDLHSFITGTLWLRLKEDVRDFRVFSREDLACAAYFHIRRALFAQSGWSCRVNPPLLHDGQRPPSFPDLALLANARPSALFRLEFHLSPDMAGGFPTAILNERMASLRRAVELPVQSPEEAGRPERGYLVAVFDTEEEWFYPDRTMWEKQCCFWLPINCRAFADYSDWRQKWDRLARL